MTLLDSIQAALGNRFVTENRSNGERVYWCPFHPDGQGDPPHRPNLHVSKRGFYCHACGAKGGVHELAQHLGIPDHDRQQGLEVTFDYLDETGGLLFQVVRKPRKKFLQRRPDGNGGWIWKLDGVRRVLYRLPDFGARPDDRVFVVEGEKDCDRLHSEGLLSTTNPGGAGKWRTEYCQALEGRDVIIVPDNDDPGHDHAQMVASSLAGIAKSIKVLDLPGVPEKGDVSDWLQAGHSVDELTALADAAPLWHPPPAETEGAGTNGEGEKKTQARKLAELALQSGIELFHDERGEPYARIALPEGRRILSLNAQDFGRWLGRLAWNEMEKAPGSQVISAARLALSSMARFDHPEYRLQVRSARIEDAIWLDLDGSKAVRVWPGGWEVVDEPPIIFRWFAHQKPLPIPTPGGDPFQVLEFANLRTEDARLLLVCYLVAALVPEIPIAALVLHGIQGSAKTTLLKIIKSLLDPSIVPVRGGVRDLTEFALAAWQNRVLYFDNLTSMPLWLSDALCRTVSGEGWSKRTLYTDEDSTVFEYRRVVGIAGINLVAEQPDLLDRSLILPLDPLPQGSRRAEQLFWREFDKVRPQILGGLLDVLARTFEIEKHLTTDDLPRMADFARWGAAAATAVDRTPDEFLNAYEENVRRQNAAALEASPAAEAILAFMEDKSIWQGTPGDLLESLERVAEDLRINTRARHWPKSPSWLTRRLREVEPNLQAYGLVVGSRKSGSRREVTLDKTCKNGVPAVPDDRTCPGTLARPAAAQLGLETPGTRDCSTPSVTDTRDSISGNPAAGPDNDETRGGEH